MTLLELCDPEPAAVRLEASVADAIGMMLNRHVGAVGVIDLDGRVPGIFTERDVLMKMCLSGRDPAHTPVRELMTTPVVRISYHHPGQSASAGGGGPRSEESGLDPASALRRTKKS